MAHLRTTCTADLRDGELDEISALLYAAFDDMTDHDVDHALGGMHVLARDDDGDLLGHAAVVARRLVHGGRALRTGYVEAMAVRADVRRQGIGTALMDEVERLIAGGYELGALGATDDGEALYSRRGWVRWPGTAWVIAPGGLRRTPDEEGYIWVLPGSAELQLTGDLACDWRDGDVW